MIDVEKRIKEIEATVWHKQTGLLIALARDVAAERDDQAEMADQLQYALDVREGAVA